jgi:hypothetical protein
MRRKNLAMVNIMKSSRKCSSKQKSVFIKLIDLLKYNLNYALQLIRTSISYTCIREIQYVLEDFFIHVPLCFVFSHRRFRRLFIYFLCVLSLIIFIWFNFLNEDEFLYPLTGAYCGYINSTKISDTTDDNIDLCSFDRIDACQLIKNRSLLYLITSTSGLMSELNNILNAFVYSIATKRRFLIDGQNWNYGVFENYFDINPSGFTPYMFANNESNECIERTFIPMRRNNYQNNQNNHLLISRDGGGFFYLLVDVVKDYDRNVFNGLLSVQRKRQATQFLWKYLYKHVIQTNIDDFRKRHPEFNEVSPFYGVHIRRGDKMLYESSSRLEIADYVKGIENLIAKLQNPAPGRLVPLKFS